MRAKVSPRSVRLWAFPQDKACDSQGVVVLGSQKPRPRPMPLKKDLPENLGEGPSCFPASVYPHSLPLNVEDLESYGEVWALKRPVCKIGCLWSKCYPSNGIKCAGTCLRLSPHMDVILCVSITVILYP